MTIHRAALLAILLGTVMFSGGEQSRAACNDSYCTALMAESSLKSYWRMNETSGAELADEKGVAAGGLAGGTLGGNGILPTSTSFDLSGAPLNAAGFGDNYDFAGTLPFSVEFWLKPTAAIPTGSALVAKIEQSFGGGGWVIGTTTYDSKVWLAFARYKGDLSTCAVLAQMPAVGSWHHLVAVWNGSSGELWINGLRSTAGNCNSSHTINNTPAWMGIAGGPFAIDEMAIYDSALAPLKIQNHYQIVHPIPPPENSQAPSIGGNLGIGEVHYCVVGAWTGGPTFSYRWLRDGQAIAGASSWQYIVTDADAGHQLICEVTGTNSGGSLTVNSATVTIPGGSGGGGGGGGGSGGGGSSSVVSAVKFPTTVASYKAYKKKLAKAKKACAKKPKKLRAKCLAKAKVKLTPKIQFSLAAPAKVEVALLAAGNRLARQAASFNKAGKGTLPLSAALLRKLTPGNYILSLSSSADGPGITPTTIAFTVK